MVIIYNSSLSLGWNNFEMSSPLWVETPSGMSSSGMVICLMIPHFSPTPNPAGCLPSLLTSPLPSSLSCITSPKQYLHSKAWIRASLTESIKDTPLYTETPGRDVFSVTLFRSDKSWQANRQLWCASPWPTWELTVAQTGQETAVIFESLLTFLRKMLSY